MVVAHRPEWSLLKFVALWDGADPGDAAVRLAGSRSLDPDRLVGLAARHGLGPALAHFLQELRLGALLPPGSRRFLRDGLERNRDRTAAYVEEAGRVCADCDTAEIPVVVTKGVILQQTVYARTGTRVFNDIDLMTLPSAAATLRDRLQGLGYAAATAYDHATGRLVPIPRRELLAYQLAGDHLPHLVRPSTVRKVTHYVLDVALSFFWTNAPWSLPVEAALKRAIRVPAGGTATLPALDPVYEFLFLCTHLFREAWITALVQGKEVRLAQFADIQRHWASLCPEGRSSIAQTIREYRVQGPVAWVVGHTDRLFDTAIAPELGLGHWTSPQWLSSGCRAPGQYLQWAGDMDDRIGPRPRLTPNPHPGAAAIQAAIGDGEPEW